MAKTMTLTPQAQRAFYFVAIAALIGIFLGLSIGSLVAGHKALTYDEPQHFRYGELIYQLNSDRFDDSKMPISVLNVVPSKLAERFFAEVFDNQWQIMSVGRISTIAFSVGLGVLCLVWAGSFYGKWIGIVALGLYVLEPNVIAHSRLITTDIYSAGMITLTLYLFWRFLEKPSPQRGLTTGLALGLAQVAKYTGLLLYPILVLLVVVRHSHWLAAKLRVRAFQDLQRALLRFLAYSALLFIVSLIVINAGFLFRKTGTRFDEFAFRSDLFRSVQLNSGAISGLPVPLPYPYLEGLDQVLFNERTGRNYGNVYMLGEIREGEGFLGYFLIASLFKVPIPLIILFVLSLADWLRDFRFDEFRNREMYLLVPALVFAGYFNLFFRAQIGIRFILVIFPLLLIFSARIFRKWAHFSRRIRFSLVFLLLYLAVSVSSYFPHYISYFNEVVLDRRLAYRVLADSNIDWGQNRAELMEFLTTHPDYIFEPEEPTAGTLVVGVNELTGVLGDPEDYAWLREGFKPVDHLDYTYAIFEISASDLARNSQ